MYNRCAPIVQYMTNYTQDMYNNCTYSCTCKSAHSFHLHWALIWIYLGPITIRQKPSWVALIIDFVQSSQHEKGTQRQKGVWRVPWDCCKSKTQVWIKGQAHNMFSRIFQIRIYEILCNVIFVLIFSNAQNWENMPFLTNNFFFSFSTEKYWGKNS